MFVNKKMDMQIEQVLIFPSKSKIIGQCIHSS